MRRILSVASKTLKETVREPALVLFSVLLPVFFLILYSLMSSHEPRPVTRVLLHSAPLAEEDRALLGRLGAARFPDGRPHFVLRALPGTEADPNAAADAELYARRADGFLRFGGEATVIRGDASSPRFLGAADLIEESLAGSPPEAEGLRVELRDSPVQSALTEFDSYVPGQLVFANLLLIPVAAFLASREIRRRTMQRLAASPLRPSEYVAGITLALILFTIPQTLLVFGTAHLFGFTAFGSLLSSFVVLFTLGLSSIATGLAIAPWCSSDSAALNAGAAFTMIELFLAGGLAEMNGPRLFDIAGRTVYAFDFLPAAHACRALNAILGGGAVLADLAFPVAATALLSLLYFGIGVASFRAKSKG